MLDAAAITRITNDKPGIAYMGPSLEIVWLELIATLQEYGINYPNVRVAMAATIAVESMFDPGAIVYKAPQDNLYCGRGLIQLTGLSNYAHYGPKVQKDLVHHPELMHDLVVSSKVAALFFKEHSLDVYANRGDWFTVRQRVNGTAMNGFEKFLGYVWPMLRSEYGN